MRYIIVGTSDAAPAASYMYQIGDKEGWSCDPEAATHFSQATATRLLKRIMKFAEPGQHFEMRPSWAEDPRRIGAELFAPPPVSVGVEERGPGRFLVRVSVGGEISEFEAGPTRADAMNAGQILADRKQAEYEQKRR